MKYLLVWLLCILILGCSPDMGTVNNMDEKFDVLGFEKRLQEDSRYEGYIDDEKNVVQQFGDRESGFVERVEVPGSYFTIYKKYYPNGALEEIGEVYSYGQFRKETWQKFSKEGELSESKSHDEPFKFTFEQVLEYAESKNIDLRARGTELHRELDDDNNPFWYLSWNTGQAEGVNYIIKNIEINGLTGEVVGLDDSSWEDN